MRHNLPKRPRSVSIIASRVIGSLLWSLVPKRNGSDNIVYGKCYLGHRLPRCMGNGHGSVPKVSNKAIGMCV